MNPLLKSILDDWHSIRTHLRRIHQAITPTVDGFIMPMHYRDEADLLSRTWSIAETYLNGPKIFRPTEDEAEMLASAEASVPYTDFRMPFSSMIVEIPEGFSKSKEVDGLRPAFVTITKPTGHIQVVQYLHGSTQKYTCQYRDAANQHLMLEDIVNDFTEIDMVDAARLAINSMLYLTVKGIVDRGYTNPGRVKQLKSQMKRRPDRREELRESLKYQPKEIAPIRNVVIRAQPEVVVEGNPIGRKQRPHDRRGHFKMQACGVRWQERRMIFVEPYHVGDVEPMAFAGQVTNYVTTET